MSFWVYILASDRNGTLYTGHTDDLPKRVWQHREEIKPGFTSTYHVHSLVWAEPCPTRDEAKVREQRIKRWRRAWKLRFIESVNPDWNDLYLTIGHWYSRDAV